MGPEKEKKEVATEDTNATVGDRVEPVVMREQFYDEVIAPKLLEVANLCQGEGISFVAAAEYEDDKIASTIMLGKDPGTAMVMLQHCIKMGRNIDGYIFGLKRWMIEKGYDFTQSIVMTTLGKNS